MPFSQRSVLATGSCVNFWGLKLITQDFVWSDTLMYSAQAGLTRISRLLKRFILIIAIDVDNSVELGSPCCLGFDGERMRRLFTLAAMPTVVAGES